MQITFPAKRGCHTYVQSDEEAGKILTSQFTKNDNAMIQVSSEILEPSLEHLGRPGLWVFAT